jgi:two-component system, NtrC family, response regulator AlgB
MEPSSSWQDPLATHTDKPCYISRMRVLVVDDEKNIRSTLRICLEGLGCEVRAVAGGSLALAEVAHAPFDLAFVDLRLANESGLDLIGRLLAASPGLTIVLITAYADYDTAVQAIKRGAWEFLPKPFTPPQIRHLVERVKERRELTWRVASLEDRLQHLAPDAELDTRSAAMRALLESVERVAASDATVLLLGENGTGKGVIARALHARSARRERPFITVNCPTLSEELLASELFGHARGAFTGAVRDQEGRVEAAQGGTLFLDEIGELPPPLQAKLLRFLQDKEFERVGETRTRRADVRVVAATNRDLEAAVRAGQFREDLRYRLNVIELRLPPLRERREDIVPLAQRFLAFFARAAGRPAPELSPEAERALLAYAWPGNVRELRNAMERALILWPAPLLQPEAFPEAVVGVGARAAATPAVGGDATLEAIEREHILRVLARTATLDEAAQILGIDASTLYRKRKRYEEG